MDITDLKIVDSLKADSRSSVKEIGKKTGIPMTTVHYRLKNMQKHNAIRFTARADRKFMGRELVAYVLVKILPGIDHEKTFENIMLRKEVEEGAIVTGEYDLILKVSVKNMDELNDFVIKYLRVHKTIAETTTMLCYHITEK